MKYFYQNIRSHNRPYLILMLTLLVANLEAATIGWFYALDQDKAAFEEACGRPIRVSAIGSGTISYEYRVGSHRVIAAKMGSGCVNTAVNVARVLAVHQVDRVVSTGPAGYLGKQEQVGKWFRVKEVVPWQQGSMKGGKLLQTAGSKRNVVFAGDDWPSGVWTELGPERLISGEVFVACSATRSELSGEFGANLVEMNAFGLMAAMQGSNKPLLILRVASDRADERAGEEFSEFLKSYDGAGGRWVAEIARLLPTGKDEPEAHEGLKSLLEGKAGPGGE